MKKQTFQQKVNDISPYSQINKAFRHVHGTAAADVLSTLIYKYTYWEEKNKLTPIKTKKGATLYCYHISKLDISLDSGVSISSLEKNSEKNPLFILEQLKLIKKITSNKTNKSDRFVLYPNRIKAEIKRVAELLEEDMDMIKKLPKKFKRDFYRSLNGKRSRDEVYKKFRVYIEDDELEIDDLGFDSENPASIEAGNSSNDGRTKNIKNKNIIKELITKKTNPSSSKMGINYNDEQKTTTADLEAGINDYTLGEKNPQDIYNLLKNYIPDNKAYKWIMSRDDEKYIEHNLSGVTPEYMSATIEYIDINVERMIVGERKMRFGSILAGIREKVIEAGIGYDYSEDPTSKLSKKEYKIMLDKLPAEEHFDFEEVL